MKLCAECSTPLVPSQVTYCSRSCMSEGYKTRQTGSANPNYRNAGQKICEYCKTTFRRYNRAARFCSQRCAGKEAVKRNAPAFLAASKRRAEHNAEMRKQMCGPPKPRNFCVRCRIPRAKGPGAYCEVCLDARYWRDCEFCGKGFRGLRGVNVVRFCSPTCRRSAQGVRQSGEGSHFWQGGKTQATRLIRNSAEYQRWRALVFERDNFTCRMCFKRGGKLTAHHVFEFAKAPNARLIIWNGVTLCRNCHNGIHYKERDWRLYFTRYALQFVDTYMADPKYAGMY